MKKRLYNKKFQIALICILLAIASVIIFIKHNPSQLTENNATQIVNNRCLLNLDSILLGKWSQPIRGHEPNIYEMSLNEDNTFSLRMVNVETKSIITEDIGTWLFDQEKIGVTLQFDNSQYWNEIVAKGEVILDVPPVGHGFLDYSQDNNSITFKVGYLQNLIDIGCEESRYAIDIIQNYLYKQLD